MSTPVDAAGIRAQYEALRREVFGARSDGVPSHGLALFLLRGAPGVPRSPRWDRDSPARACR